MESLIYSQIHLCFLEASFVTIQKKRIKIGKVKHFYFSYCIFFELSRKKTLFNINIHPDVA